MDHPAVFAGLTVYLVLMLIVGLYASRRVGNTADFVVAGKRLSLPLCSATLAATWFGGGICIGAASAAYKGGLPAVMADPFGAALCLFLAGLFYVRIMRRMGLMTIASFFSVRFGPRAGLLASLCTVPAYVGWTASLMVAFGRIFQSLTGVDPSAGIIVAAVIVIAYTVAGGMWAVSITDFIQVIVLIAGLALLTPLILHEMGGWAAIAAQIPVERFHMYPHDGNAEAWFSYARDWLVIGLGNLAGQDLLQRSLASRDETVAYRSAYVAGFLYLTVGLLPVILGMAGAVLMPNLANPDLIMMALAIEFLPEIALVLFMGALVSALLSSADSALLAPASIIGWDVLRFFKPRASETMSLRLTRLTVVALGIAALLLALYKTSVYELMIDSWSVLLATLFVPLTAGIWWPRGNGPGALAAIGTGFVGWQVLSIVLPKLPADLLAVPFAGIAMVAVSKVTGGRFPPHPLIDDTGNEIACEKRLGWNND